MLKKLYLTRPTPARQDAPFPSSILGRSFPSTYLLQQHASGPSLPAALLASHFEHR